MTLTSLAAGYAGNPRVLPLSERTTYDRAFIQVGGMWAHGGVAKAFTFSKRLASAAAGLMGADGALLHHDQALFKEAGGGFTPWHCDQQYWPLERSGGAPTISAWIPLADCPIGMGPLMFAQGSHRWQPTGEGLQDIRISDESEQAVWAHVEKTGATVSSEPLLLGDVSFHNGWTLHRANANETAECREAHTIQYTADNMRWSAQGTHRLLEEGEEGVTAGGGRMRAGGLLRESAVPVLWDNAWQLAPSGKL